MLNEVVIVGWATAIPADLHRPAWLSAAQARRLDPLAALCCAAVDRLPNLSALPEDSAVIVGTAWGTIAATQRFADSLRAYGDGGASPTAFITSVHHNAAGTVGEALHLHGPAQTVSLGGCSGLAALRTGALLVASRRRPALVIAADTTTPWCQAMIANVTGIAHPEVGGAIAFLLMPEGHGWRMHLGASDLPRYDAGGATPSEARVLAHQPNRSSAHHGPASWWPTVALARAPWHGDAAFAVCERESGLCLKASFVRC